MKAGKNHRLVLIFVNGLLFLVTICIQKAGPTKKKNFFSPLVNMTFVVFCNMNIPELRATCFIFVFKTLSISKKIKP